MDIDTTGYPGMAGTMDKISIRLSDDLLADLDAAVEAGQFDNRSEAIRAAIREFDLDGGDR